MSTLIVKGLTESWDAPVQLSQSVGMLKTQIGEHFKLPLDMFRLIFAGVELKEDEKSLDAYNIIDGS